MCDCAEEEGREDAAIEVPLPRLIERTLAVEARREGDRVPEHLWPIFFGERGGSIPWPHHLRMVASRAEALALLTFERDVAARRERASARLRDTRSAERV